LEASGRGCVVELVFGSVGSLSPRLCWLPLDSGSGLFLAFENCGLSFEELFFSWQPAFEAAWVSRSFLVL